MPKDWKGNHKSTMLSLGAAGNSPRVDFDLYTTDQNDFKRFLHIIKKDNIPLLEPIIEPSAGLGDLSHVLQEMGLKPYSFDVVDRSSWENYNKDVKIEIRDFLEHPYDDIKPNTIITNPPFIKCEDFTKRALRLLNDKGHLMLFLRIQFLESLSRYHFFMNYPIKYVYVYSSRAICYGNGIRKENDASPTCYAWFIWQKGFKGDTIVRWIPPTIEFEQHDMF